MSSLMVFNWFGRGDKSATRKENEAVRRVIESRQTVTDAASRLVRALDLTDSRMALTLGRLSQQRRERE
jgi:hypothetical protein